MQGMRPWIFPPQETSPFISTHKGEINVWMIVNISCEIRVHDLSHLIWFRILCGMAVSLCTHFLYQTSPQPVSWCRSIQKQTWNKGVHRAVAFIHLMTIDLNISLKFQQSKSLAASTMYSVTTLRWWESTCGVVACPSVQGFGLGPQPSSNNSNLCT